MAASQEMAIPAARTSSRLISGFRDLPGPHLAAILFFLLIAVQAVGYLILGTGRAGRGLSEFVLVLHNLLAFGCASIAFRRAQGAAALFWFLFAVTQLILLAPTVMLLSSTLLNRAVVSDATWRVLFCLYGAPILMMLFLPAADRIQRIKSEVFLDLFQVGLVVVLTFTTFFYLPVQRMLPADAFLRTLNISNLQSLFLLVAVLIRLRFASVPAARNLFFRLGLFLFTCAVVTFVGNWIDARHLSTLSAWWDLGWALPYVAAGLVALTWTPSAPPSPASEPVGFFSFLGKNLVLVAILFSIDMMMDQWEKAHGAFLTNLTVSASLLAFTVRLALTQFRQQKEISHRRQAQDELSTANNTIADLLEEARTEASIIAQVSQLGSLLQACSSRHEAFRLLPEWLARLFPGTSGSLSMFNPSRTYAEPVATWGDGSLMPRSPAAGDQPDGSPQTARAPITVPLIVNEDALGILTIQDDGQDAVPRPGSTTEFSLKTQTAYSVAEHLALTISNLDLREALLTQATHDSLTGLFNRGYLQASLEREGHRARRRRGPLSLMMLDIDHFKRYNDNFGHAAGDEALRLVAETLRRMVRAEDLPCRYGGEEFVVLLPDCPLQNAALRAEEIRQRLKDLYTERKAEFPGMVTVSIGVAAFHETTDQLELLLKCADEALYKAKHGGRDRVVVAEPRTPMSAASAPHTRTSRRLPSGHTVAPRRHS